MQLKAWRKLRNKTLAEVARELGISGSNPSRTVQRHETGEVGVNVPLAIEYARITDGAVTFADFFEIRRDFLASRGASSVAASSEAAA